MIGQVARDTYILLGLGILVLAFIAYELAGLTVPGFHTISWLAKHNHALFLGILLGFMAAGFVGPIWWYGHILYGNISR